MTTEHLLEKKDIIEKRVAQVGQQQTARELNISRSTLRDFLYRNNLITKKQPDEKEKEMLDSALLEVAELVKNG